MNKVKFLVLVLVASLSINLGYGQAAKVWGIDPSHSSVNFSVDHFFSAVTGKFKKFDGEIRFDPNNLKGSGADITIQVGSVDTDDETRDKDLNSESFFNAAKYPTIKFTSNSVTKTSENMYEVKGKLTMKDVTKDITFMFKVKGVVDNPWKEGRVIMGVSISTALNRTEYGVGVGNWAATAVVGHEVSIDIHLELDAEK